MVQYVFRDGPLPIKNASKADAQVIGEAFEAVAQKNNGHLTPGAIVNAARSNRHPLHRHFDWDDAVAGEKWRLEQARGLIQIIVADDDVRPGPAFISIAQKSGTSYRSLADVLNSASLQLAALEAAERDLRAFERRYQAMADICSIIRKAREQIAQQRASMESRGEAQA